MGAGLSIFVLLSLSVFVIRVASVALRLTGLTDATARFQALSAFTGTGFTTVEAETIVNYPVRRKIISLLMIIGNLGLVGVFATLVVSLVHTEGETGAVLEQLAWLAGGLSLLWFVILNKTADRLLCKAIGRILIKRTELGQRSYHRLLQLGNGISICEHPADAADEQKLADLGLEILAIRTPRGKLIEATNAPTTLDKDAKLILYGKDQSHESLTTPTPS